MVPRLFTFVGGNSGPWQVTHIHPVVGETLSDVPFLDVVTGADTSTNTHAAWSLCGITSNERYVMREEKNQLIAKQEGLGRTTSTCAALIPIRKSADWWALTQDERRSIFEAQSHHTKIGMHYLPAIARKLHHCRDLSENEPFDFLTWFEFAPDQEAAFDQLLAELRATKEWSYVEREVDIRLVRV